LHYLPAFPVRGAASSMAASAAHWAQGGFSARAAKQRLNNAARALGWRSSPARDRLSGVFRPALLSSRICRHEGRLVHRILDVSESIRSALVVGVGECTCLSSWFALEHGAVGWKLVWWWLRSRDRVDGSLCVDNYHCSIRLDSALQLLYGDHAPSTLLQEPGQPDRAVGWLSLTDVA